VYGCVFACRLLCPDRREVARVLVPFLYHPRDAGCENVHEFGEVEGIAYQTAIWMMEDSSPTVNLCERLRSIYRADICRRLRHPVGP